jgi:hypothetical protein
MAQICGGVELVNNGIPLPLENWRGCRGCNHMVVGFINIYAISVYHH